MILWQRLAYRSKHAVYLAASVAWITLLGPIACAGSVETQAQVPEACQGRYTGSFSGDSNGTLDGTLGADAEFNVTFTQTATNQSASGSGSVDEDGTISLNVGPNSVSGVFNFDRCRASGQWAAGNLQGSWNAARR